MGGVGVVAVVVVDVLGSVKTSGGMTPPTSNYWNATIHNMNVLTCGKSRCNWAQ